MTLVLSARFVEDEDDDEYENDYDGAAPAPPDSWTPGLLSPTYCPDTNRYGSVAARSGLDRA
jgi:hypothetical protein